MCELIIVEVQIHNDLINFHIHQVREIYVLSVKKILGETDFELQVTLYFEGIYLILRLHTVLLFTFC
jgi:hypothetical protein